MIFRPWFPILKRPVLHRVGAQVCSYPNYKKPLPPVSVVTSGLSFFISPSFHDISSWPYLMVMTPASKRLPKWCLDCPSRRLGDDRIALDQRIDQLQNPLFIQEDCSRGLYKH
jgi:hypothetical protein